MVTTWPASCDSDCDGRASGDIDEHTDQTALCAAAGGLAGVSEQSSENCVAPACVRHAPGDVDSREVCRSRFGESGASGDPNAESKTFRARSCEDG